MLCFHNSEEYLLPLERPAFYTRHDGTQVLLSVALLGLLGDHLALDDMVGVYAKACRVCLWPKAPDARTKAGSRAVFNKVYPDYITRGKRSQALCAAALFQQHICEVINMLHLSCIY